MARPLVQSSVERPQATFAARPSARPPAPRLVRSLVHQSKPIRLRPTGRHLPADFLLRNAPVVRAFITAHTLGELTICAAFRMED